MSCGCNKAPSKCKGSGVAVATTGSCGCGGGGCATCEPRSFIRPRFFAGQLLTDEDLALLGDYVVAKNRLHNRALWGPGVVCGLDVNCDPCGGGSVIVQPGYAINCCGDDIVVPCPESVDVLALIRDLRRHSLGAECADPCDQPRPQRPPAPATPPAGNTLSTGAIGAAISTGATSTGATTQPNPKAPVRRYYLYIRYAEDLTDPVSPYATDEPCAGQACEPTRVREGHTYELRCENDNPHFLGLGDRFIKCIGDLAQARAAAVDATVTNRVALRLESAQRVLAQTPEPVFVAADLAALSTATSDLQQALGQLPSLPAPALASASNGTPATSTPIDPDKVRTAVEALRMTGSLFARLVMTPVKQRPDDTGAARIAGQAIANAQTALPPALPNAGFATLEMAEAQAVLDLSRRFSKVAAPPAAIAFNERLWSLGAPLNDALLAETRAAQGRINSYVAPILQTSPRLTDCELLAQFEGIRPIGEGPINATSVNAIAQNGTLSSQVLGRLLFGCLCDAFNPPCQGCDDPAVLLAELCVQDCVVIDICEMVRRFVITWPSVRYWTDIPNFVFNINAIGDAIETLCCETRARLGSGCPPSAAVQKGISTFRDPLGSLLSASPALASATATVGAAPLNELGSLLSMIQPLATATAMVPGSTAAALDPEVERTIQTRVNDAVTTALASTDRELTALRAAVTKLGKRKRG